MFVCRVVYRITLQSYLLLCKPSCVVRSLCQPSVVFDCLGIVVITVLGIHWADAVVIRLFNYWLHGSHLRVAIESGLMRIISTK